LEYRKEVILILKVILEKIYPEDIEEEKTHMIGVLYDVPNGIDLTISIKEYQNNIDE